MFRYIQHSDADFVDPSGLNFTVTLSWVDDITMLLQLDIVSPEFVSVDSFQKDELFISFEQSRFSFVS